MGGRLKPDLMEIDMDRQLFILVPEIWASVSKNEIIATAKSMSDAGILNFPYEEFDVRSVGRTCDIMTWLFHLDGSSDEEWEKVKKDETMIPYAFRYYDFKGQIYSYSFGIYTGNSWIYLPRGSPELLAKFSSLKPEVANTMNDIAADAMLNVLLVMLATKNVEKEVLKNPKRFRDPMSKSGIKQIKNKEYEYITTIKIGKITDTMRFGDHRGPVRPHLRRGHLRNQRIGEGRKEVKQIFIQPVFVNADDGWIENQRKEYRVKL